jgi:hypothetical protein
MMQFANVSHGKTKMNEVVRRRVTVRSSLYRGRVVRDAVLMLMKRKKVMKKQRRDKEKD